MEMMAVGDDGESGLKAEFGIAPSVRVMKVATGRQASCSNGRMDL